MTTPRRVVLDTDLGSDVDDLMALAVILGSPSLDLVGITTVYGDTALRARLTKRVLRHAGRSVPVHAGERDTLSGKEIWWAGHEGRLHADLEDEAYESDDAVQYLVDTVLAEPGAIDVMAIGPLTNVAAAIEREPAFASAVRHLWIMGGAFADREPEHNFASDATAARIVFGSGIPATVTGLEVTRLITIGADALARIAASGELGRSVDAEVRQWWAFWNTEWNVPHDPVTVLSLTEPDRFVFSPYGTIDVVGEGDEAGVSVFSPGDGPHRITTDLDATEVASAIVDAIVTSSWAAAR
jgi:purine nucleosidase